MSMLRVGDGLTLYVGTTKNRTHGEVSESVVVYTLTKNVDLVLFECVDTLGYAGNDHARRLFSRKDPQRLPRSVCTFKLYYWLLAE
jgi:hypothetical protein